MHPFVRNTSYTGPVLAVVLDWAGTTVDYGCLGPAAVFVESFRHFGITVELAEARQFMGLEKKEHVRSMLRLPRISRAWVEKFGRQPGEDEVDAVYAQTEPMMVAAVANHAGLIPGTIDFVVAMRRLGIRIGSTTGYTRSMMNVLFPLAAGQGYRPDAVFCSSDVPAGRPYPWMCWQNAIALEIYPLEAMVKIGDTISDIEEGLNAGMWTIGLTRSGNQLGMSREETDNLPPAARYARLQAIGEGFTRAGAHYVAEGIWDCLPLIQAIEARLRLGERPYPFS